MQRWKKTSEMSELRERFSWSWKPPSGLVFAPQVWDATLAKSEEKVEASTPVNRTYCAGVTWDLWTVHSYLTDPVNTELLLNNRSSLKWGSNEYTVVSIKRTSVSTIYITESFNSTFNVYRAGLDWTLWTADSNKSQVKKHLMTSRKKNFL